MTSFTVTVSAFEPRNSRYLHFKADGKRFGEERTVKISCDAQYDLTITVKPNVASLQKVVMGGDEITPQSKGDGVYLCSWVTKGYQPTRRAARHDMRVSLTFDKGDLTFPIQCKFYAISDSTHLTWGTAIKNLEVESVGTFESGAAPFQTFPAKRVLFK